MSRVGKQPIPIPSGVEVSLEGSRVEVKGPKGTLVLDVVPPISVTRDGDALLVQRPDDARRNRSLHGLMRTLVSNMVVGVSEGFERRLEIVGVGYRAQAQGADKIEFQLGYSHPITFAAPEGITFEVPAPTQIAVKGIDKQVVGQVAAEIRALRKPEPYKGKGIRYAGERIIRKAGKSAGS
jgi:large subunit ribosomal protein L6